jgi:hypothetical protein
MNKDPRAQENIARHFRVEFEKQRAVTEKEQHDKFRQGITRLLSNYILYDIRK